MNEATANQHTPWTRLGLGGLLIGLPFLAIYAVKGLVALVFIAAAVLLFDPGLRQALLQKPRAWPLQAFGLLALWALATTPWAVEPDHSFWLVMRLLALAATLQIFLTGVARLSEDDRRVLNGLSCISGLLLLVIVGAELLTDLAFMSWLKNLERGPGHNDYLTFINSGIALLGLFVWPFALSLHNSIGKAAALTFAVLALLVLRHGNADTPLLGFAAGAIAFLFALVAGRAALRTIVWGTAAYIMSMPLLLHLFFEAKFEALRDSVKSWSAEHRFHIWQFGYQRFLEKPFLGWGLDGSRELPGGHQGIPGFPLAEYMPLHPHNSALQVWLELGLPGVLAFVLALILIGRRIETAMPGRLDTALAAAAFAGFEVQAQLSFSTWQNAWLSSLIVLSVLCLLARRDVTKPS